MPKVFNKRHNNVPKDAVYIGRPTKWGNPFSHLNGAKAEYKVASREEAVRLYESWINNNPDLIKEAQRELKGKDLVCWCAPHKCHGEVLIKIANPPNYNSHKKTSP